MIWQRRCWQGNQHLSGQVRPSLSDLSLACLCIRLVEHGHLVTTLLSTHVSGHSTGDYCLAGHHPMCLLQCADRRAAAAPSLPLPQRAGLEARYGSARSQGTCMHVCFALLARVLASVIQQGWGQGNMMRPGGHSGNHQQHAIVATAHRQLQPMSPLQLAVLQALQHSPLSVPLTAAPCCYSPRCCVGGCSCASTLTSSGSSVKRRSPWRLSG